MSLEVTYHPDLGVVESTVTGTVTPDLLRRETVEMAAVGGEHQCERFLSDFSQSFVGFSITDVFGLPTLQRDEGLETTIRVALLPPEDDHAAQLAQFYITASHNRGWTARVCADRQEALDFLTS